jgi:hypothetical protein
MRQGHRRWRLIMEHECVAISKARERRAVDAPPLAAD